MLLRNVLILSAVDGVGTLVTTIVNDGPVDDALLAVEPAAGTAVMRPQPSPLPGRGITVYGVDTSQTKNPDSVLVRALGVRGGYVIGLHFIFRNAAPVELDTLVVPPQGPYDHVPVPSWPER